MDKILWLTLEFPPQVGGVGRMYRELCRAMPAERITVWAPPLAAGEQDDEPYSIRRQPLLARRGWPRWLKTVAVVDRYLREQSVANVVVGQVLPLGIAVWLISLWRPIRYAVFVHGLDVAHPLRIRRRRWLLKRIFERATVVFAANRFMARLLIESVGLPAQKVALVYPSPVLQAAPDHVVLDRVRWEYRLTTEPILLTVGRLVERKGHEVVLRALEVVWQEVPATRYVVIGGGSMRARLKVLTATLSRPEHVMFLGELPDEEVAAWLSLATVFIMTPRTLPDGDVEGLGIAYLEAGVYGKPVIGSQSGGVPEAVVDGGTGLLVPENDVVATAAAILKLLRDLVLCRRMGERGRERALKEFTPHAGAETILRTLAG